MRSTTNLLIINLAVSDILFVIFCVPFTATDYVLPEWPFGNVWCKFVQYMIVVTCHCRWVSGVGFRLSGVWVSVYIYIF
ncbi:hypothetical protein M5D96_013313 [Drosophila gunungcola]|uniref:G-protein coupled receptors family 1 profile domain-containing protein n=1 Tax=Drosophila gunungcola TaxID=103775 RepID=A0A9P9YBI6_9MUSC|nr:hypothetical protein M5D96_013313 [Drosophila gunungcola]